MMPGPGELSTKSVLARAAEVAALGGPKGLTSVPEPSPMALLGLMVIRVPRVRRLVALAALALGLFSSYSGLRAAEQGRKLVYNYAVGVSTPAPPAARSSPLPWASVTPTASPTATRR